MQNLIPANPLGDITRIEYNGQLVLTTAQLADFYDTSVENIKRNFSNNSERYIEGKHYFKLEGTALASFKNWGKNFHLVQPNTRTLYLWTKRGCARHCKSVGTDVAWEVFELLEDTYFNLVVDRDKPLKSVTDFQRGKALVPLAQAAQDPYTKKRLVAKAANLILGEEFLPVPIQNSVQLSLFTGLDSTK